MCQSISQLGARARRWVLVGAAVVAVAASAQTKTAIPYPRIELGEHTATIRRLAVDRAERWLVTASEDKTARIWNLQTGRLERVLRPPLGEGDEGKLRAVAISPDGSRIALGGFTGADGSQAHPIHLFDRSNGRLLASSQGFSNVANHLSFSPDGKRLAAVFGSGAGMRILDAANLKRVLARDDDCKADGQGADFSPDGRLVTSCYDGVVRLYDVQGRRIAQRKVDGGARPSGVRFAPDGQRIAVGFADTKAVRVLSGRDLTPLYSPDTRSKVEWNLMSVAWSRDGQRLYAAGGFRRGDIRPIVSWPDQGRGAAVMLDGSANTILDLAPLSNGRVAYASEMPDWGVLGPDGQRERLAWPAVLDHLDNQPKFRISADAKRIEFGFDVWDGRQWSRSLARFDLAKRRLQTEESAEASGLYAPRTVGLPVTDWKNSTAPKFNGQKIALQPYETSKSIAVAADKRSFVLGMQRSLRSFDATGRQRWRQATPGVAWSVNLSPDGRFLVAALGDGTLRWYDAATGRERLALFIHARDKRWLLFTPEGFYQASRGGDTMIGYHFNQGADREGQFIDSAQLAGVFFRPDLISKPLTGADADIAEAVRSVGDVRAVLAAGLPPTLTLLSPAVASSDGEYELIVRVSPGDGPVGELKLFINDAEVTSRAVSPPGGGVVTQRLTLAPGDNRIGLRAMRADGKVASNEVQAQVQVKASTRLPVLRVLAVGISQYDDAIYKNGVKFAASDAQAIVDKLSAGAKGVYREVDPRLLNRRADTTLERISAEIRKLVKRSQPEDVVVIFLAGHGKAPDGREYHFIPADFIYDSDQAFKRGKTLTHARLEDMLKNLGAGKRLLILDTCDSGSAVDAGRDGASEQKDALARLMRSSGRYILAAASQQGKALEVGAGGHGVYTAALLEGIAGAAGSSGSAMIDVDALADYVSLRVPELTLPAGYEQRPMRSAQGENFPLIRRPRTP